MTLTWLILEHEEATRAATSTEQPIAGTNPDKFFVKMAQNFRQPILDQNGAVAQQWISEALLTLLRDVGSIYFTCTSVCLSPNTT